MRNKAITSFLLLSLSLFPLRLIVQAQKRCDSGVLITIERQACFGSCPIYSAQIYSDGNVVYVGKRNVKVIGERRYKISPDRIQGLIEGFQRIKYLSLKDRYDTDENGRSMTDLPTTITSICLSGKKKKIIDYYCAPKELLELENKIESVAGLYEFIGPL